MQNQINQEFHAHLDVLNATKELVAQIEQMANICTAAIRQGNKLLLFGNGGSAADAQHIAAELVGRYKMERKGLPAIALTTDSSAVTAIGNDYGYEYIFSRQVEALADLGDVLLGISTSGNSQNVINGLKLAQQYQCRSVGLTGKDGGQMKELCDVSLVVPSDDTARIQEMHILIGHTLCHLIEQNL